jgi:hypothetical protein
VREGMAWLAWSAAGDKVTRYHVEGAIAREHRRAPTFAVADGRRIAELYDTLDRIAPSPLHTLGRAVAEAYLARRPSGKRSQPLSQLARGDRRARFPPQPTRRRRVRLARSTTFDHRPRRSRVLAAPPRRLPAG